ncbi:MAG: site-specific integrase [Verrucomicrobiaceae bacterium]|jgi:site-specific recombinase XerD|nr:site-specific integrase [Verrucomicrobiaceae bacterium]NCF89450.1 site-specific integrase [Verrucomicrobiaceae bacterium]
MKLEERLKRSMRLRQMALTTDRSYVQWYRRFVHFYGGKRHPETMGAQEVEAFLTHLAAERNVAPSTQNQALNALVFLYREVLEIPVEGIDALRARERQKIPVVLTTGEVKALLGPTVGDTGLAASLLYGCGLRLMECLRLRVKDMI